MVDGLPYTLNNVTYSSGILCLTSSNAASPYLLPFLGSSEYIMITDAGLRSAAGVTKAKRLVSIDTSLQRPEDILR